MKRELSDKLTHLIFHELSELGRIVAAIQDILHEILLLHFAKLLLSILLFVEGVTWPWYAVRISVKLLELLLLSCLSVSLFDHVYPRDTLQF